MNQENNNNVNNTQPSVTPVNNNVQPNSTNQQPIQPTVSQPNVNNNTQPVNNSNDDKVISIGNNSLNAEESIYDQSGRMKKEFVIKSKKETVEEERKIRDAKIDEKIKKANENYVPNSKFKNFGLVLFFVVLIGFVIFLPEIEALVAKYKSNNNTNEEKITTGTLVCEFSKSSENLDFDYTMEFGFSNSKLKSLSYTTEIKGDAVNDADELSSYYNSCVMIEKSVKDYEGITITCKNENNKIFQNERFSYSSLDTEKISPIFAEAGGIYPEYKYEDDIDTIEKNMDMSGYKCERVNR